MECIAQARMCRQRQRDTVGIAEQETGISEAALQYFAKGKPVFCEIGGLLLRDPYCPSARLAFTLSIPSNSAVAPIL